MAAFCSYMMKVGLRALKNETSKLLRRVAGGEQLVVTDRGRPIALLVPVAGASGASHEPIHQRLRALREAGRISWAGGKPQGLARAPVSRGASVADAVSEDRR